ncbi:hypothetical protein ABZV25_12745, partial [Micrococcus luteus]
MTRYLVRAASLAAALTAWQLLTSLNVDLWLRFSQFPTVADVARAFGDRLGGHDYWTDLTDSLTRIGATGAVMTVVMEDVGKSFGGPTPVLEDVSVR